MTQTKKTEKSRVSGFDRLDSLLPNTDNELTRQAKIFKEETEKAETITHEGDEIPRPDSLDKENLPNQDSLCAKESLSYKERLDQASLAGKDFSDKGSLPGKESSDQVSLSYKDSLSTKKSLSRKDTLPQESLAGKEPLAQESLATQVSLPLSLPVEDSALIGKIKRILLDKNLTQSAKILLSHLIVKERTFKVRFTYRQAMESLNMSMPTVIKAVDSLRSIEYLEVYTDGRQGTIVDCFRAFSEKSSDQVSLAPHDNNYSYVYRNKHNIIMSGKLSLPLIALLAVTFDLKKQDFSRAVLIKMKDLTIDSIALVFAYTVKEVPHSGNARAGYIFKTIENNWDKALDLDMVEKAKKKIPPLEKTMKAKMADLGRNELIEIASLFGRAVSQAEETEMVRSFVQKKLEAAKELEKHLNRALSEE